MKLIFGVNTTDGPEATPDIDGAAFIAARLSAEQQLEQNEAIDRVESARRNSELPLPLRVVRTICGWAALVLVGGIVQGVGKGSFERVYANAPWAFWVSGVGGAVWLALALAGRMWAKRVLDNPDTQRAIALAEDFDECGYRAMGVPEDAADVDMLMCRYRVKDGEIKAEKALGTPVYTNVPMKTWRLGGALCLADTSMRLELPLDAFRGATVVKQEHYISGWNKDEWPDRQTLKAYRLVQANGSIVGRRLIDIELSRQGENYVLRLPVWERDAVVDLTGWNLPEEF